MVERGAAGRIGEGLRSRTAVSTHCVGLENIGSSQCPVGSDPLGLLLLVHASAGFSKSLGLRISIRAVFFPLTCFERNRGFGVLDDHVALACSIALRWERGVRRRAAAHVRPGQRKTRLVVGDPAPNDGHEILSRAA
eukprot:scaffold94414_cov69-Phaeocystis_antarctica.AAC.3